jgi:SAM-dependent methyltransferase
MTAEHFWDREVVAPTHTSWMEHPRVREYILRSITRSEQGLWPVDWFMRWLGPRRFERALSIGCGTGPFERDVVKKNLVGHIDAFDGSTNSLRIARDLADKEGILPRIHYFAADFNRPHLRRSAYDIVFIHQALHHVVGLEKLLREILFTLKSGGLLYLDEYIGPSRNDWNRRLIRPHRQIFERIPPEARRTAKLDLPIQADDPSEAVRSSEILSRLAIGFDIVELRGYGGNLLSVLYPAVDFQRAPAALESIIAEEQKILAAGEMPYYAVIVAKPKEGSAGIAASRRYRVAAQTRGLFFRLTHQT